MKKNLFIFFMLSIFLVSFSSCLKDKDYDNRVTESVANNGSYQKVVSIGLTTDVITNINVLAFNGSNDIQTIEVPITLSGGVPAENDVHVVVALAPEVVNAYNSDPSVDSVFVPAQSKFTLVGTNVTIPKGQSRAVVKIQFKSNDLVDKKYAVPLKIVSVDNGYQIAANGKGNGLVIILVKNKYDGNYDASISTTGWAAYGISDGPDVFTLKNLNLVTTGAGTVIYDNPSTGALQFAFSPSGSLTAFGATEPQITFDLGTDAVASVINLAAPDSRNRSFMLNPAVTTSKYDPATHNIFVSYLMNQNGRPTMVININFKYKGPRP